MFKDFKIAVQQQFETMKKYSLFETDVDKDLLWEIYLKSFPPGTNEIFRERTEHDCSCCRNFIRSIGNVVAIDGDKLISIWDCIVPAPYDVVTMALSEQVKSAQIKDTYFADSKHVGTDVSRGRLEEGKVISWDHFYCQLPAAVIARGDSVDTLKSRARGRYDVLQRSLREFTLDAMNTVLELVNNNSIYRGTEYLEHVKNLIDLKHAYESASNKSFFCWIEQTKARPLALRNSVIGTLIEDISKGKELEVAVASFETKVAPQNYKRSSAVVTQSMLRNAEKAVKELGIERSLARRYATKKDISVNDMLFVDRNAKTSDSLFDQLASEAPVNPKNFNNLAEIHIEKFISDILPQVDSIELMLESRHKNNLMSLIAPADLEAPSIFKWSNNFSWSYNGEVTDSIKERVKKAGGNVEGALRISLSWRNTDDLDLHCREPGGNDIYYGHKYNSRTTGRLDVDMNVGSPVRDAVENIVWTNESKMEEGVYEIKVNNYRLRERHDVGFDIEMEYRDKITRFGYDKMLRGNVTAVEFHYSRKNGIEILESLPSNSSTKQEEIWGVNTNRFNRVSLMTLSPNYWGEHDKGNKHYLFMLEGCTNKNETRGFYNEFLSQELHEHRKVFELLGSKMKVPASSDQLSGLGFSSTQQNSIYCRTKGQFSRIFKLVF